jgi:micrococcal nuclease
MMYEYKAHIMRVIDGDTLKLDIDMGRNIHAIDASARLARINAPELSTSEGVAAKDFMKQFEGLDVRIISVKPDTGDKYGRWLVEVFVMREGTEMNLNDYMVTNGHAVYHTY